MERKYEEHCKQILFFFKALGFCYPLSMRFSAILFDLDGTLIDTISLYRRACIQGMASAGLDLTHEEFDAYYVSGSSLEEWIRLKGGEKGDAPLVRRERDRAYHMLLRTEPAFFLGAEELLNDLLDFPKAIVTGSWKSYVDALDECVEITKHFPHIITADDTSPFHKPHPHGLLLAADRLGVDPRKCVYIGDQMFDIDAAHAAGMTSCLVPTQFTPKEAHGKAEMELESLDELLPRLRC